MPPRPDRTWPGILGRYVLMVIVLTLVATAAYAAVEPADRLFVLRLAVGAFVTVVLVHLYGHFRRPLDEAPPSAFDEARRGPPVVAKAASVVTRLQEHVQNSVASQRYFDAVLWPRLEQLSGARGIPERFQALRGRRWLKRGPSLPAIAELVRHIGDKK
jgi:hypothetical protein